ncbi:MAG: pilus assembly protein PilM [Bdellovibrionota bacterium]|nr:pilus assembly protein PilM [Bdellovibrionota bacterium]
MRSIGIDIGRYSIKIAVIESTRSGYIVRDYFESMFSTDLTHDPYIHTLDVLRRLSASFDPATTKYCLALPQASICSRFKLFPFKGRAKVIKSIAFELEDDIPYDQDEAIFDAKILGQHANNSEVLALATPHEHVRQILHLCEEAGIDPDIISMEASAMTNLIEEWWKPITDKPAKANAADSDDEISEEDEEQLFDKKVLNDVKLLLNIGHSKTLITAYSNSTLVATHSIAFGGKDIVRAVMDKYSLSYPEAIKTVREKAFLLTNKKGASKDQVFFSDTISNSLKPMIQELKRFLLSMYSDFHYELDSMFVTGGVANLINIGPFFTQNFEVAVNPYTHSLRHTQVDVEVDKNFEYSGSLAVGLAIEGIKQNRNPAINFRQGELGKQSQLWKQVYEKWGTAIQMGVAALVCLFIYAPLKNYFAGKLVSKANSSLSSEAKSIGLRGRDARLSGIKRYIKKSKALSRDKKKMLEIKNMSSALDVVAKLSTALPSSQQIKLDLSVIELENEDLKLEGYVRDQNEIKLLENSLRAISYSGYQKTRSNLSAKPGKLSFAYTLKVNRMEAM